MLYPYLTVEANIGFPLESHASRRRSAKRRVLEVRSSPASSPTSPANLASFGRSAPAVAMGRAIVREPAVFLMDEPLANLDAKLRVQMRADIAALQERLGVTMVYVNTRPGRGDDAGGPRRRHGDGHGHQCGPPRELYEAPVNMFVAGFIASPPGTS